MTWLSNLLIPDEVIYELRDRSVRGLKDEDVIIYILMKYFLENSDKTITKDMCIKMREKFGDKK